MGKIDKNMLMDLVNSAFNMKYGESLFVEGNINYGVLIDIGTEYLSKSNMKVELKKSDELTGVISDVIIQGDKIIIENSVNEYVKFIVKAVMNEFDTINSSINMVLKAQHDDKVASIIVAERKYRSALQTVDSDIKRQTLLDAESQAMNGIGELEREIKRLIDRINKIPNTFIEKVFSAKIKSEEVDQILETIRESISYYEMAIMLINCINCELNEVKRVGITINESIEFFENILTEEICIRMSNFDLIEDDFWNVSIPKIAHDLKKTKYLIDKESTVYLLNIGGMQYV